MKLALFHFNCLEHYPPAMNMIRDLAAGLPEDWSLRVYSSKPPHQQSLFEVGKSNVVIKRFSGSSRGVGALNRYWNYIKYNIGSFLDSWFWKPDVLLYIETLSAFPAILLTYLYQKKIPLFIHYHEYYSPREYAEGMLLNRIFHKWEVALYPYACWLSHTHAERMKLFQQDFPGSTIAHPRLLANYPPSSWQHQAQHPFRERTSFPLKIIYIGALSLEALYFKEFALWVEAQEGRVQWDIYSLQDGQEVTAYLHTIRAKSITFRGAVAYDRLPQLLAAYHIGVILYRSSLLNVIYSVPNKLLEYATCGLDVWFPVGVKGSLPTVTTHTYPKILAIDFERINDWNLEEMISHEHCRHQPPSFTSEQENQKMVKQLLLVSQAQCTRH